MKAKSLEKIFDEGKDVTPHLVLSKARRPGHEQRRVNVDFPNLDHRIIGCTSPASWGDETVRH